MVLSAIVVEGNETVKWVSDHGEYDKTPPGLATYTFSKDAGGEMVCQPVQTRPEQGEDGMCSRSGNGNEKRRTVTMFVHTPLRCH